MTKFIGFFIVAAIFGCNENKKDTDSHGSTSVQVDPVNTSSPEPIEISGCYRMVIEKDTAFMQINRTGDAVSGHLSYKRFEKDSNDGDFMGSVSTNGEIMVWYKFKSEGVINVRQSVFKIKGNTLAEGYGDIVMQNDTAFFKFPRALAYEENHPFIKIACP